MRLEESFGAFPETPFVKLDGSGGALTPGAGWAAGARVIHDRNTGLFWELKSPEAGSVNDCGARYTFAGCGEYLSRLNAARFGGFDDWRLPNRDELRSLMDYGREDCALDPAVFENAPVGDYWTKKCAQKAAVVRLDNFFRLWLRRCKKHGEPPVCHGGARRRGAARRILPRTVYR